MSVSRSENEGDSCGFVLVWEGTEKRMRRMRVLIQSTISHLYLMAQDAATQNPEVARDFKHTSRALKFIEQNRLTNVQIVLKFPKTSDDVNLAILELLERDRRKKLSGKTKESFQKS